MTLANQGMRSLYAPLVRSACENSPVVTRSEGDVKRGHVRCGKQACLSSPCDGNDLRASVGQGAPGPVPELLLDRQSGAGQERGQRIHIKEP